MFVTQGDLVQCFLMNLSEPNPANLRQWSQQAKKRKRKKQKKDRKQTEEQNFLALGELVRSSNKVFIESNSFRSWLASFFAPTAAYMMEWLRDKVMCQRLTKNEILFKQKGVGISRFCQRRVFAQEDPEKRRCFRMFDHKLTKEGKCEVE